MMLQLCMHWFENSDDPDQTVGIEMNHVMRYYNICSWQSEMSDQHVHSRCLDSIKSMLVLS